jgi:polysaccharide pyruvyl transferase WcaK-like protein
VREDLIALLKARGARATAPELLSDPVPTVNELLGQLRETDAVISPRFHNLVLALLLNKPVIALSDLPKVTALLADLGLERYCLSLEGLTSADLADRFAQLESDAGKLKGYIGEAAKSYRRAVDEQYGRVYGDIASPKSSH